MAHVRERSIKDGSPRYAVVWRDPAGKNREKWFSNRRAADRYAAKQTTAIADQSYTDDRSGRRPLAEVAEAWLSTRRRSKPETLREHRRLLSSRVYPVIPPTTP